MPIPQGSRLSQESPKGGRMNTQTRIESNGSKVLGQEPDPVESLIERLGKYTIDPYWGTYVLPRSDISTREMSICGNFVELSAVYRIFTVDERLLEAVWSNLNSERFEKAARRYPVWPRRAFLPVVEMARRLGFSPVRWRMLTCTA
ncbi:MAG: hypothetical protein A2514_11325 [Gammaproteobacteria bacterium RIFOXYD12_FULL_61_37]|nr:MAG: hypothetical protein A2514_11325 [Gammaproteobacteria bacterium RIFOXYD12_FULL_61_37]